MTNERANLDLDDDVDLLELTSPQKKTHKNNDYIKNELVVAASESGFVSRESSPAMKSKRRRRVKSPYTEQQGIRVRPISKEVFIDIGERLGVYDQVVFEKALEALAEKHGFNDLVDKLTY